MAFEYKSGPLTEVDTLDTVCDRGNTTDQAITTGGFVTAAGSLSVGATSGGSITDIKDEDNMVSDSQTALATQQSIKAYADALTLDNVCDIGSVTDQVIEAGGLILTADSNKILLGAAQDAAIYYNNTNLVIDPKEVGTGYLDLNGAYLKSGNTGIGIAPIAGSNLYVDSDISQAGYVYAFNFRSDLHSTDQHVYGFFMKPSSTLINYKDIQIGTFGCTSLTVATACDYLALVINEPSSLTGTLQNNYGIKITDFTKGANNYAIYTDLGPVSLGDDLILRIDSDKIYLGAARDAYIQFDGDSLNIVANVVTGTDDLNLTADITNLDSHLTFADAKDITFNTTTGTKIGTATSQKLSFYNATPVDQPVTVTDAATQDLTGGDTIDKTKLEADLTSCKDAVNAVIDRLQELGLIA